MPAAQVPDEDGEELTYYRRGGGRGRVGEERTNLLEELFEDGELSLPLLHVLSEVVQSDARSVAPEVGLQAALDHRYALVHQVEQRVVICETARV